jgi:hypothetical protein
VNAGLVQLALADRPQKPFEHGYPFLQPLPVMELICPPEFELAVGQVVPEHLLQFGGILIVYGNEVGHFPSPSLTFLSTQVIIGTVPPYRMDPPGKPS